jgi:hypothetical protein
MKVKIKKSETFYILGYLATGTYQQILAIWKLFIYEIC